VNPGREGRDLRAADSAAANRICGLGSIGSKGFYLIMEARAITKFIRLSPRKVRLVVDQIRGKGIEEALNILKFTPKRSALIVSKTLRTAVANAESTQSVDVDQLYVKQAKVDEAGMWKRFTPRAQGRATRIRKRLSHITIVLDEVNERR
jgi:large subunit ribosomal protein L22